jgi:hypothetical protein
MFYFIKKKKKNLSTLKPFKKKIENVKFYRWPAIHNRTREWPHHLWSTSGGTPRCSKGGDHEFGDGLATQRIQCYHFFFFFFFEF